MLHCIHAPVTRNASWLPKCILWASYPSRSCCQSALVLATAHHRASSAQPWGRGFQRNVWHPCSIHCGHPVSREKGNMHAEIRCFYYLAKYHCLWLAARQADISSQRGTCEDKHSVLHLIIFKPERISIWYFFLLQKDQETGRWKKFSEKEKKKKERERKWI